MTQIAETLIPVADRIAVRPITATEQKYGSILIPENAKEKPMQGEVIAVGKGRVSDVTGSPIAMTVGVGDRVLYGKYSGTEVTVGDEEILIIREADVLAILKSADNPF